MENLNNLIWTDENANNGAAIQSESRPMKETCFRGPDEGGSGGGFSDISDPRGALRNSACMNH